MTHSAPSRDAQDPSKGPHLCPKALTGHRPNDGLSMGRGNDRPFSRLVSVATGVTPKGSPGSCRLDRRPQHGENAEWRLPHAVLDHVFRRSCCLSSLLSPTPGRVVPTTRGAAPSSALLRSQDKEWSNLPSVIAPIDLQAPKVHWSASARSELILETPMHLGMLP
jgi:hypothetical protein